MEKDNLYKIRHSLSHILAMAVLKKFPKAKLGIGPVIETGFYYDFLLPGKITDSDLATLEDEMKKIIKQDIKFSGEEVSRADALKRIKENQQPFKEELINDLGADEKITFYTCGDFVDLCAGGHVDKTSQIDARAFKLSHVAGAYWRGDEKREMLTRIYGLAFESKADLEKHLEMMEQAKQRDHRKLGKELDLFTFSDLVGAGLPLFTPKGTIIRTELQNALLQISKKYGMQPVSIPHLAKKKLYEISGHAAKFADELIKVISHYEEFVMKPVNCPHHTQIYASSPRSYRDLPLRYMESTMQYRDEKPGEIGGLTRVRSITCDDGHIFCTLDQAKDEAKSIAKIIEEFYTGLGMYGTHWVSWSVRDPKAPEKYIGEPSDWDKAEQMLKEVSDDLKLDAQKMEGEAALYGPKLDYMFKDSLGRERQLATIQLDFSMPKRFGLTYVDSDGAEKTPVMIHRAILGSYERFMAILIEHFAGAFPLWLSPVQIKILTVSEKHIDFTEKLAMEFRQNDLRVETDKSAETIGNKIRKTSNEKVPFTIVIGDREMQSDELSIRVRGKKDLVNLSKENFIKQIQNNVKNRLLELL